jgi:cobalamin biosynthesis protein CobT
LTLKREAKMEILGKVAKALSRNYGVKVTFKGDQAQARGNEILLPALPPDISEELAQKTRGFADHEIGHIRFSDAGTLDAMIGNKALKNLTNLIEDMRVERLMGSEYVGARQNLEKTANLMSRGIDLDHVMSKFWVEGRRQVCGHEFPERPDFTKEIKAAFGDDVFSRIANAQSSWDSMVIAKELLKKYEEPEPEPRPEPDKGQSDSQSQSEEKSGSDKPDQGEDEDNDDGTGGGDENEDEGTDDTPGNAGDDKADDGEDIDGMGDGRDEPDESDKGDKSAEPSEGQNSHSKCDRSDGSEGNESEPMDSDATIPGDGSSEVDSPDDEPKTPKPNDDLGDFDDPLEKLKQDLENAHAEAMANGEYLVLDSSEDILEHIKPAETTKDYTILKNSLGSLNTVKAKIAAMFLTRTASRWLNDREEGKINARSLCRIKAGYRNIYREKYISKDTDTAITFLVDWSGSMTGNPIFNAMRAVVMFLEVLANSKIKSEVLAYTTRGHMGAAGVSNLGRYGRVERLVTWILKDFSEPLNNLVKKRIGAFKGAKLSQNCDPENVVIAYKRLMQRPEKRKILFVLSDGEVNNLGNDHLGQAYMNKVCTHIQKEGAVELIGVELESRSLKKYIKNTITVNDGDNLARYMTDQLKKILKVD